MSANIHIQISNIEYYSKYYCKYSIFDEVKLNIKIYNFESFDKYPIADVTIILFQKHANA